jgi:arylsulfate sulfotransferase
VPVFGVYAGYESSVQMVFTFVDGTTQINNLLLTSPSFVSGIFTHPVDVVQARTKDTNLSYDFMMLKSAINPHTPMIIDTDGNIRWVGPADTNCTEVLFDNNGFYTVDSKSATATAIAEGGNGTTILRNEFDGAVSTVGDFAADNVVTFHHNFDFGKTGILTGVTTPEYLECTVVEVGFDGSVLHTWDMAKIISDAMIAGGDDPTKFVAASGSLVDWFHNNASTYRPSEDEIVISSRENFVIALDYETGAIKWILGDPTKQWHEFPSLAKYALTLPAPQHYPIGQHAVSFFHDKLLLFDDGYASADHMPAGMNRTYSAPRKYSIDEAGGTATELWHYLNDPPIYSPITSSVYEDRPGNYLIDYAVAGPYLFSELIGLDPVGAKVFDYKYTEVNKAGTDWNTVPIHLENLDFE